MAHFNDQWSQDKIKQVWEKGVAVPGYNPESYRRDVAGAWMRFSSYGDVNSDLGWEIDHRKPLAKGGMNDLSNLRPLHWRNNRSKGDNYPRWLSVVSSDGNRNIDKEQGWIEH